MLYGSQTGNAESIARDVSEKLNMSGVDNKCFDLNSAKGLNLKDEASCLLIVCSTTGNGDTPENATNWWRTVKLRSAVRHCCTFMENFVSNHRSHVTTII